MPRIYAKVSIEMWGDKKFVALSPMKPSGQALWLYLLTGEFRTSIPGLSLRVGVGALADRLKWPNSEVDKRWREIEAMEMGEADWSAGVIWLPRGIEHNEPESPNVIRGWGKLVLPECDLVQAALGQLRQYIALHLKTGFSKAFDDVFVRGSARLSPNQEQEQQQEYGTPQPPALAGGKGITRAERMWAEETLQLWRHENRKECPHEPICGDRYRCVGRVVGEKRVAEIQGVTLAFASVRRVS